MELTNLFALYFAIGVASLGIGVVLPIIPMIIKGESGSENLYMGLSATIMALSFSLSSFPIGKWIDKTCPKNAILFGLAIYCAAMSLFPYFHNITAFLAIRALEGVGWGAIWMGAETQINLMSDTNERGRNMGIYGLCVSLGMAGGPLIGTFLLDYGIAKPFFACIFLTLCSAVLAACFVPHTVQVEKEAFQTKVPYWSLRYALLAAFLYGIFEASMMSMFPAYFLSIPLEKSSLSVVISSFFVGGILFQIPAGKMADKFGKERTLIGLALFLALTMIIFCHATSVSELIVLGFLAGACGGAFYPVGLSILPDKLSKKILGAGNANFTFIYGLGSILGPVTIAFLMDNLGNRAIFYSFLPLCFAFVCMPLFRRKS